MSAENNTGGYILTVEDEPVVQKNNKILLERRGYKTKQAYSIAEAWEIFNNEPPVAIILDVQLPDGLGLDFLRKLRKSSNIPVLMLTALDTPQDVINGLDAGGDDYLTKPYDRAVFLARVAALMRRASVIPDTINIGPIQIDIASGKAYFNGEDLYLQQKEFALLQQFAQHPNITFDPELLYEKVWGQKLLGHDNSLKVAVSKLRTKLSGTGYTIYASRGEGYSFEIE